MQSKTIVCFCKQPQPGRVKTRLSADLGENYVVSLYKVLVENLLSKICENNFNICLYCYPNTQHPFFEYCKDKYDVTLHKQHGKDLGERMYHAIKQHLSENNFVVLVGTDCPELDSTYINDAFQKLDTEADIVLGPAFDGGYALIGANKIDKAIFRDINWSTNDVLNTTTQRIKSLGWSLSYLSSVRDIDELADYEYFSQHKEYKYLFVT